MMYPMNFMALLLLSVIKMDDSKKGVIIQYQYSSFAWLTHKQLLVNYKLETMPWIQIVARTYYEGS